MQKTCETCYYDEGIKCEILKNKIEHNCFAWADEAEAMRRESAIQKNTEIYPEANVMPKEIKKKRKETQKQNLKLRGGKTNKEILDKHFGGLYSQQLTDTEISEKLHVHITAVNRYRRIKGLPKCTKNGRPAATEATESQKAL
nr:MAG TPA: helix-turn-helix domain protein [Caudoviricetes sp.]